MTPGQRYAFVLGGTNLACRGAPPEDEGDPRIAQQVLDLLALMAAPGGHCQWDRTARVTILVFVDSTRGSSLSWRITWSRRSVVLTATRNW